MAGLGYAGQSETRKGYTCYEKDTESGLDGTPTMASIETFESGGEYSYAYRYVRRVRGSRSPQQTNRRLDASAVSKLRSVVSNILSNEACASFINELLTKTQAYLEAARQTNSDTGLSLRSVLDIFDAVAEGGGFEFNNASGYSTIRGRLGDTANPPRVLLASGYFYSDDVNDPYFTISEYGRSASDSAKRRLFDPNDGGLTVIPELLHFNFHDLTLANALGGGFKNL